MFSDGHETKSKENPLNENFGKNAEGTILTRKTTGATPLPYHSTGIPQRRDIFICKRIALAQPAEQ